MKRVMTATPTWPPKIRMKCMNPENVAALVALVKAPASSPSRTILLTRPTYVHANPLARRSSTISKLLPAHEVSTCAQIQQATATIVSPAARISLRVGVDHHHRDQPHHREHRHGHPGECVAGLRGR